MQLNWQSQTLSERLPGEAILANIPQEMKDSDYWCNWEWGVRTDKAGNPILIDGKIQLAKIPIINGRPNNTDSITYDEASIQTAVGFRAGSGYCLGDLDHCFENGKLKPSAKAILNSIALTYVEISPSMEGLRIIWKGEKPEGLSCGTWLDGGVKFEVWDKGRFTTITGRRFGIHADIAKSDSLSGLAFKATLDSLDVNRHKDQSPSTEDVKPQQVQDQIRRLTFDELEANWLNLASKSRSKVFDLFVGDPNTGQPDLSSYDSDHSRADQAFVNHLHYWFQGNYEFIDKIFRRSSLMRDKWDVKHNYHKIKGHITYGEMTMDFASTDEHGQASKIFEPDDKKSESISLSSVVVPFGKFSLRNIPKPISIIHGNILCEGGLAVLYGYRGCGKTYVSMLASMSIAAGVPFLHWKTTQAKTLYVDGEMSQYSLQERANSIAAYLVDHRGADIEDIKKNFILLPVNDLRDGIPDANGEIQARTLNLEEPADREELMEIALKLKVKLITLDNLSALTIGREENSNDSLDAFNQWQFKLRSKLLAVMTVHHAGKNGLLRGASRLEDPLNTTIKIENIKKANDDEFGAKSKMTFEKHRDGDVMPRETEFHITTDKEDTMDWNYEGQINNLPDKCSHRKLLEMMIRWESADHKELPSQMEMRIYMGGGDEKTKTGAGPMRKQLESALDAGHLHKDETKINRNISLTKAGRIMAQGYVND